MDGFEDVQRTMRYVADYWIKRKWTFLNEANEEFVSFVDPAFYYQECLTPDEVATVSMCFTEWVLFERPLRRGKTPLQILRDEPPRDAPEGVADILRAVDASQEFSRFAICDKDVASGMVILRDVRTDRRYDVLDPHICAMEHWDVGTVAVRIACVRGMWQPVGQVYLYDHVPARENVIDGPGEIHPEDCLCKPEAEYASFYLRLLRDILGIDGRYHKSARVRGRAA